jgi:LEA14-like dessication related protein
MKKLLYAIGLGGIIYGAYRYYQIQSDILYYSKIKMSGLKIKQATAELIIFEVKLKVTNNSEFAFTLMKYNLGIYINNNKVSDVKNSNVNEVLEGNGSTSEISFDVKFNPKQFGLLDLFRQVLSSLKKTVVGVRGDMKIKKGILNIDIPLDLTYKVDDFV